jgi:hypothetical protein
MQRTIWSLFNSIPFFLLCMWVGYATPIVSQDPHPQTSDGVTIIFVD